MPRTTIHLVAASLVIALAGCMSDQPAPGTKVYTKEKRNAAVLSGGSGYHGAYLKEVPAADKTAAKPKPVKGVPGKLPVPTQYPLSPEDVTLWNSLTVEKQKRALLFLQDGSTIAASLRTE